MQIAQVRTGDSFGITTAWPQKTFPHPVLSRRRVFYSRPMTRFSLQFLFHDDAAIGLCHGGKSQFFIQANRSACLPSWEVTVYFFAAFDPLFMPWHVIIPGQGINDSLVNQSVVIVQPGQERINSFLPRFCFRGFHGLMPFRLVHVKCLYDSFILPRRKPYRIRLR